MTLSNIGLKIVNLGSKTLMPGDSTQVTNDEASTPAVKALINHGFLKLDTGESGDNTPVKENPDEKKSANQTEQTTTTEQPKEDSKDDKKAVKKTADK